MNPWQPHQSGTFEQKVSFSSGKCKKTFEIRGGKLEVRVSLGGVFNRQVNTFLERDVSKQALHIKENEKFAKHGPIVDFLNKRESVSGIVIIGNIWFKEIAQKLS